MDVDLAPGAEATVPSFLRGRALWVAARLAPGAPPDAAGGALRAALGALAPDASAPLRVGACRALAQYVPLAPRDVLLPLLGPAYQGLGTLLETAAPADAEGDAPEETLHLVLEAMLVVVKADADAAAAWSGALAPATLRVWAEKVADPLLAADARDVLEALAATPACLPSLHALAAPTLAGGTRVARGTTADARGVVPRHALRVASTGRGGGGARVSRGVFRLRGGARLAKR